MNISSIYFLKSIYYYYYYFKIDYISIPIKHNLFSYLLLLSSYSSKTSFLHNCIDMLTLKFTRTLIDTLKIIYCVNNNTVIAMLLNNKNYSLLHRIQ